MGVTLCYATSFHVCNDVTRDAPRETRPRFDSTQTTLLISSLFWLSVSPEPGGRSDYRFLFHEGPTRRRDPENLTAGGRGSGSGPSNIWAVDVQNQRSLCSVPLSSTCVCVCVRACVCVRPCACSRACVFVCLSVCLSEPGGAMFTSGCGIP